MATTDAISVACKQLGFRGRYWGKDSSKYDVPKGTRQEEKPLNYIREGPSRSKYTYKASREKKG